VLASIVNRSSFLIEDLLLSNLGETVVIHGYAPHDGPRPLVSHLVGNRASFLCTKAPMLRVPDKLSGWHSITSRLFRRSSSAVATKREGQHPPPFRLKLSA
jgi:hypothetical protein